MTTFPERERTHFVKAEGDDCLASAVDEPGSIVIDDEMRSVLLEGYRDLKLHRTHTGDMRMAKDEKLIGNVLSKIVDAERAGTLGA
jgi:hypothetical protein